MAIPKATTLDYDPNVPVYVSPQTTETTTQLGDLPSNSTFVDENNTVQGRMTGLLGADSELHEAECCRGDEKRERQGVAQFIDGYTVGPGGGGSTLHFR